MTDNFTMSLVAKAEILGWHVAGWSGNEWEFRRISPAGEDFSFEITSERSEDVWYEVYKYAKKFDIDAHAEKRAEAGCNLDAGTLWEDAYDLQEMMEKLADVLEEITRTEEEAA